MLAASVSGSEARTRCLGLFDGTSAALANGPVGEKPPSCLRADSKKNMKRDGTRMALVRRIDNPSP